MKTASKNRSHPIFTFFIFDDRTHYVQSKRSRVVRVNNKLSESVFLAIVEIDSPERAYPQVVFPVFVNMHNIIITQALCISILVSVMNEFLFPFYELVNARSQ